MRHTPAASMIAFALAASLAGGDADAAVRTGARDARELVRTADVVFRGVVIAVDYRTAAPAHAGGAGLPHTFVTYRVHEVFKGRIPAQTITLRFVGGRRADGVFLEVSNAPLFDLGDEDVLFVRANGVWGSPLVDGTAGRLRVIGDEVFDDDGLELYLAADGVLETGAHRELEEVRFHRADDVLIEQVHVPAEEPGADEAAPIGERLSRAILNDRIHALVAAVHDAEDLARLPVPRSADPDEIIPAALARPATPPAVQAEPAAGGGPADLAEEEALLRNGGNPVLPTPFTR